MIKYINSLNLVLIALVGGLCIFQWAQEKEYGHRISELDRTATTQASKIAEQNETLRQASEDITGFKSEISAFKAQVDELTGSVRDQKAHVFTLEEEKQKLAHQSANLQLALEEYKKAVTARADNIKTLLDQREQLLTANKDVAGKANQAISAFNDLNTKYEDVVNRYNTLATIYKTEHEVSTGKAK